MGVEPMGLIAWRGITRSLTPEVTSGPPAVTALTHQIRRSRNHHPPLTAPRENHGPPNPDCPDELLVGVCLPEYVADPQRQPALTRGSADRPRGLLRNLRTGLGLRRHHTRQ
jgi:hypothetical protein